MVERSEGVGLAATKLSDQSENWRRVLGLAGKSPEDHAGMLVQRARETGARKELDRIAVVLGCRLGEHLLKGDSELVRAE